VAKRKVAAVRLRRLCDKKRFIYVVLDFGCSFFLLNMKMAVSTVGFDDE